MGFGFGFCFVFLSLGRHLEVLWIVYNHRIMLCLTVAWDQQINGHEKGLFSSELFLSKWGTVPAILRFLFLQVYHAATNNLLSVGEDSLGI